MSKLPHEACNRTIAALRAALVAAEAKLADERKHADALAEGHRTVCAEGGRGNRDAALNCMETATRMLAAHAAARAAHDDQCESEFDSQVHAQTPCGCAARRQEASDERP